MEKYWNDIKPEIISDLAKIVKIPSVSNNDKMTEKALDFALDLGRKFGFSCKKMIDGQIGVIEMGEGSEVLGILTHVDVVNEGNLSLWNSEPFELTEVDGKLFGRGSLDDKGPLIAVLYAMKKVLDDIKKKSIVSNKKVQLIIGTKEEVQWTDMDEYVSKYPLPDYGFTPDGSFPICNIEKGYMDLLFKFPLEVNRNENVYIKEISGGSGENIVPGSCKATLSNGKVIESFGKAVHSCQPEKGENAILLMGKTLKETQECNGCIYNILVFLQDKFEDIYGIKFGLDTKNEYYNGQFIHKNVMTPTLIYTKDNNIFVNVNIRYTVTSKGEDIIKTMSELFSQVGGIIDTVDDQAAVYVDREKPFISAFSKAYEDVTGQENSFDIGYGGSYCKAMDNIVSWGPVFSDEEDTCHEENEYISTEALIMNAAIFEKAIYNVITSKESLK